MGGVGSGNAKRENAKRDELTVTGEAVGIQGQSSVGPVDALLLLSQSYNAFGLN
jgi:hypothetical protein